MVQAKEVPHEALYSGIIGSGEPQVFPPIEDVPTGFILLNSNRSALEIVGDNYYNKD